MATKTKTPKKKSKPATKPFSKMTKPEKRIAIANDVLMRLRTGKFKAEAGEYISIDSDFSDMERAQKVIKAKETTCTVCAKGALFCSDVALENKLTLDELKNETGVSTTNYGNPKNKQLLAIFSVQQLDLIECAFETSNCSRANLLSTEQINKAIEFGNKYQPEDDWGDDVRKSDKDRLQAICKNIIKNNGTFKP